MGFIDFFVPDFMTNRFTGNDFVSGLNQNKQNLSLGLRQVM